MLESTGTRYGDCELELTGFCAGHDKLRRIEIADMRVFQDYLVAIAQIEHGVVPVLAESIDRVLGRRKAEITQIDTVAGFKLFDSVGAGSVTYDKLVIPFAAIHFVVTGAADHKVVAAPAVQVVIAVAAGKTVISLVAEQLVVAIGAID